MSTTGAMGDARGKPMTPYKVVSNKTENILRRDLKSLDKQQTYVLKKMEREQRVFRRSLDSLQSQRNRSSAAPHSHTALLSVPGYGASSLTSSSPRLSRHLASSGMASNAAYRSVSAGVPSPPTSRQTLASRSRSRAPPNGLDVAPPNGPRGDRRGASSALSPLASNVASSPSVTKSWASNNSGGWRKPPTGLTVSDMSTQKAASTGNIRDAELFAFMSVVKPDHRQHTLPPLVGSASVSQTTSRTELSAAAAGSASPATRRQAQVKSSLNGKIPVPLIGVGGASPHTGRLQAGGYVAGGDSDGESAVAGSRIRIVKSQHLFKDLSTSLPRITTSRPGTAVMAPSPDGDVIAGAARLQARMLGLVGDSDGEDTDGEVISNGFEDALMGANAQGGKPLAKVMDEIKECRYIRHYNSGKPVQQGYDQDAVRKIFAD